MPCQVWILWAQTGGIFQGANDASSTQCRIIDAVLRERLGPECGTVLNIACQPAVCLREKNLRPANFGIIHAFIRLLATNGPEITGN